MNTEDEIKKIISPFLRLSLSEINNETLVNKKAIPSSVIRHRMFSKLKSSQYEISKPNSIETFGDIIQFIKNPDSISNKPISDRALSDKSTLVSENPISVGIDIENINNFPDSENFSLDPFYLDNFSKKEIAFCSKQPTPLQSFAGRFAVKEAIIKADNSYKKKPFNEIEIITNAEGKPFFNNFSISISHTEDSVIAIALRMR